MPRSLRNVSQAVEALRYVASDSELSRMKSASRDRKKELFDLFWKRRDPTPATAFNERMAEFYRRVDYAMDNFESFHESNGMKTDRGKAYILYGPPGTIERDLRPGSDPQETWNYPNLRKRLVFVDRDHHGDYRLAESKDY
jgi:GWxTD domain-containing protein